jgi:hypothetical protein
MLTLLGPMSSETELARKSAHNRQPLQPLS